MAKDLRKLFEKERADADTAYSLKADHKARFLKRLENELPPQKKSAFPWLKIAATVTILLAATIFYLNRDTSGKGGIKTTIVEKSVLEKQNTISLGDLSPDLKKVETYYVTNINLALSELEVSQENKEMTDGFMKQLNNLNTEYQRLTEELNTLGPNDQTITALIKNLQLRLQLLQKLKTKLNELKSSKNEQVKTV
ncbi:hypothetical protein FGM00_11735 [Aggregatimonas sangjinii]|uniref:Anti-sigma factor n=1 Tax=Aggregatimonas sangjinii TaxID=2583587 RepID=A0A5B7SPY2_9FLAO|nr:hypothetical protein [Aggregatimonas sangjinii]QCX00745.1 hypothetical protein FGM00_11735 [Aggregatimonas sangjinii]